MPKSAFKATVVAELGSGYGRNWPLLKSIFSMAIILQFEQSQANIDQAVAQTGVPREARLCISIQEMDWAQLSE